MFRKKTWTTYLWRDSLILLAKGFHKSHTYESGSCILGHSIMNCLFYEKHCSLRLLCLKGVDLNMIFGCFPSKFILLNSKMLFNSVRLQRVVICFTFYLEPNCPQQSKRSSPKETGGLDWFIIIIIIISTILCCCARHLKDRKQFLSNEIINWCICIILCTALLPCDWLIG